MTIVVCDM
jgi:hypothetical protein